LNLLESMWKNLADWWHMPTQKEEEVDTSEDKEIMEWAAKQVVSRQLTVPAIIFFESVKPLNFIASQALIAISPMVMSIFQGKRYKQFTNMLERRGNIELLIQAIEEEDARFTAAKKKRKGA